MKTLFFFIQNYGIGIDELKHGNNRIGLQAGYENVL